MERISRTVQTTPGLSKKAIETQVHGKTATKQLALELLVQRGYIEARPGPRGAINHHHQRPYYQPTDTQAPDPDEPDNPEDWTP
jgi:DNA-binding transcriptional MocR family regulator